MASYTRFFFQAEDGIRDKLVTGVQTCALPISATFSKAKMSSNVAVDYTQRKNVWKPKGAKPGMWLYENYETVIVEPLKDML